MTTSPPPAPILALPASPAPVNPMEESRRACVAPGRLQGVMQLDLFSPNGVASLTPEDRIERWTDCPGFDRYEVSSMGRFRVREDRRIMNGKKIVNGYVMAQLSKDKKQHCKLAHRLVCIAFHGPPPFAGAQVNHINRSRNDNRVANLEWVSRSGNALHWRTV